MRLWCVTDNVTDCTFSCQLSAENIGADFFEDHQQGMTTDMDTSRYWNLIQLIISSLSNLDLDLDLGLEYSLVSVGAMRVTSAVVEGCAVAWSRGREVSTVDERTVVGPPQLMSEWRWVSQRFSSEDRDHCILNKWTHD